MIETSDKRISRKKYYLIYSGIFLFCIAFFVSYLFIHKKTNINRIDGMTQYYPALLYYSRYLKGIINNFVQKHELIVPLWDFSIGEGSDIIQTLHTVILGDPFALISLPFPEKYMYFAYMLIMILKMYVAGVFFSELCFYLGHRNHYGVIAGTLAYTFCFWAIKNFTFHLFFFVPYTYLPLLILGVEKVVRENKGILFILAVFLCGVSNLYFFYMEALATGLYGLLRTFLLKKDFRQSFITILRLLAYAIVGMLMASVILCPMIYTYFIDNRMTSSVFVPATYPVFYYERLFSAFISNDSPYDLCLGFVSPTLLSIMLLIKNHKRQRFLFTIHILYLLFLLFPVFGSIWNGLSYVSQRWSFVIALPVAYDLVLAWDEFKENRKYMLICLPLLFCALFFSAWARNERVIVPFILCVAFCLISISEPNHKSISHVIVQSLLISIIVANILYLFQYNLSQRGGGIISDLEGIDDVQRYPCDSEAYIMKEYVKTDDLYRYSGNCLSNNVAPLFGTNSTNYCWSITNPYNQRFRMDLGLRDYLSMQFYGYDDRAELESLANVKYYVYRNNPNSIIPFGFEYEENNNGYEVYKNKFSLPFGYTYANVISDKDYTDLDMLEKQDVMMQNVVIDNETNSDPYTINETIHDYSVTCDEGILLINNQIIVENKEARIHLLFSDVIDEELYLLIENLKLDTPKIGIENDSTLSLVQVHGNSIDNYVYCLPKEFRYSNDKYDHTCYFGKNEKQSNEITISFSLEGIYSFDEIKVVSKTMSNYEKYWQALSEEHMESVAVSNNTISGSINVSQDKYLLLSIPYSKGWKAFIDGEETDILLGNSHYIALFLDKGEHSVELEYSTPGLKLGAVLSAIGVSYMLIVLLKTKDEREKTPTVR